MPIVPSKMYLQHLIVLLCTSLAAATPFPKHVTELENGNVLGRACVSYCGFSSQVCCATDEVCYTDVNSEAQCSTASSPRATVAAAVVTATLICRQDLGEAACGSRCCPSGQSCNSPGECIGQITTITSLQTATQPVEITVTAATTAVISTGNIIS